MEWCFEKKCSWLAFGEYTFPTTSKTLHPSSRLMVVYLVYAEVGVEPAATSSVAAARKRKARGSHNRGAQDERKRKRRAALLLAVQGSTEAGT